MPRVTGSEPLLAFLVPLQSPEAVHEVALLTVQVSVVASPAWMLAGVAVKLSMLTAGTAVTVTPTLAASGSPSPLQSRLKV